jgi:hypothetical protein
LKFDAPPFGRAWYFGEFPTMLTNVPIEATSKKKVALLNRVREQGLEIVKTETLRSYDGTAGYSLSQGQ